MTDQVKVILDTRILDAIVANLPGGADKIVGAIAFQIEADAKLAMGTGPEGATYYHGGVPHVASAEPGPPAVDTGALRASIKASRISNAYWQIADGVEYGAYLEYGTPHMGPRPWMTPAIFKAKQTFNQQWPGLFK